MNKIIVTDSNEENRIEKVPFLSSNYTFQDAKRLFLSFEKEKVNLDFSVPEETDAEVILFGEQSDLEISYHLGKGSHLIVRCFALSTKGTIACYLEGEKASFTYHYAAINDCDVSLKTAVHHLAPHSISNMYQHVVVLKGATTLDVDGIVPKDINACVCNQDNKIINLGTSDCTILPNLRIDNYDVVANHAAFIGKFSLDELFYLMSRGLDQTTCYQLLIQSFLFGKMSLREEEKQLFYSSMTKVMEV